LCLALDRAGRIESHVPADARARVPEEAVVPHRQHVVEAVDTDALSAQAIGKPLTGAVCEHLLLDPGRAVLADVAGLAREDDRRLALSRQQHVRIAVHDLEPREVSDGALEAGVLAPAD